MVFTHAPSFCFTKKRLSLEKCDIVSTEWSQKKGITINLAEVTLSELDQRLRQFYAEARNQDGGNHSRATLLAFRNNIERYLNSSPNNRGILLDKNSNLFCQTRC